MGRLHPLLLIPALSAVASLGMAAVIWRRRGRRGAPAAVGLLLSVAVWALANTAELFVPSLGAKMAWTGVAYVGIVAVPVCWFIFSLEYTTRGRPLRGWEVLALLAVPIATLALVWTSGRHGLMQLEPSPVAGGALLVVRATGRWFWMHTAYSYLLLGAGAILLLRILFRSTHLFRRQAISLLIAVVLPWLANLVYLVAPIELFAIDLTPPAFALSLLVLIWGIERYGLLDVVPAAHDLVVESMADGVLVFDGAGRLVDHNHAAGDLLGLGASHLGQAYRQVLADHNNLARLLSHRDRSAELLIEAKERSRIVEARVEPLRDGRGQVSGQLMVLRDVTERLAMAEALQESEARFRAMFEEAAVGIALYDDEGTLRAANPALKRMFGYTDEALPDTLARSIAWGGEAQERLMHEQLLAGQRSAYRIEWRLEREDGQPIWVSMVVSAVRSAERQPTYTLHMVEDITERRRATQALIEAEKLAITGRIAASVAHEVNNPLQSVMGVLGLVDENLHNTTLSRSYLTVARDELRRAAGIIRQMRDLSRHSEPAPLEPKSPIALVERVLFLANPQLQRHHIAVEVHAPAQMPHVRVAPDQVQQVFLNLVLNAADAMPQGGQLTVTISVTRRPFGVHVSFTDTGEGIPVQVLPRVFDSFFSTKPEGLGLGLWVSRGIVEQHGGNMEVTSRPDEGTTFTVWLPADSDASETPVADHTERPP